MAQSVQKCLEHKKHNYWKPHQHLPEIFINQQTHQQAQRYSLPFNPSQQTKFEKRVEENYQFILKVKHVQVSSLKFQSKQQNIYVYIERMLQINRCSWVSYSTPLSILKGFRRISSLYGWIRVSPQMIGMNEKGQIVIWIHDLPTANQPKQKANCQEEMLTDIIEIIAKYDPETEKLLRNSHSINSAINTIFTKTCSITPTAKQTQSKINKKSSFAKEDLLTRFKTQNFLSTDLKKREINFESIHLKAPKFIGQEGMKNKLHFFEQNSLNKNQIPNCSVQNSIQGSDIEDNLKNKSEKNNGKNSFFTFKTSDKFKIPIPQLKKTDDLNLQTSINTSHNQMYIKSRNGLQFFKPSPHKNVEKESQRFSELSSNYFRDDEDSFNKQIYSGNSSELMKANRFRTQQFSKVSDRFQKTYDVKKKQSYEESIKRTTSGERIVKDYSKKNVTKNNFFPTQKGKQVKEQKIKPKRFFPGKNEANLKKKPIKDKEDKKKHQFNEKEKKVFLQEIAEEKQNQGLSDRANKVNQLQKSQNFEERKVAKQQLSKKLKNEFNCLFGIDEKSNEIENNFDASNMNQKSPLKAKVSTKDMLIKEKVQRKKATFAQLKSEALKILSDDIF